MKRTAGFLLIALLLTLMSGCNIFDPFGPPKGGETEQKQEIQIGEETEAVPDVPEEPEFVYTGRDKIFYDNTQAMFSFTRSPQYIAVIDALMKAEGQRDPAAHLLQIAEGSVDKENKLTGYLHWAEVEFDRIKTNFSNRNLYTFAESKDNGIFEIPKLQDKGPLGLLFEDQVLDINNLSIVVTDLMENGFGLSQLAEKMAGLLENQKGVEAALYGFQCSDFSGNLSYPDYTPDGAVVKTVLNYRGIAPCYILVLGPTIEVEAFDSRFRSYIDDAAEIHRVGYINSDSYTGETGISAWQTVQSLTEKVKGGNAQSLNYTVNADLQQAEGETFRFVYNSKHTAKGAREQVQLSLMADLADNSPFLGGGLTVSNLKAEVIDQEGNQQELPEDAVTVELKTGDEVSAWKDGFSGQALEPVSEGQTMLLRVNLNRPEKKETVRVTFDLTAERESYDWIERYSADITEYHSLSEILPSALLNDRHLNWQAGATDILTRTVGLQDFDLTLSERVPETTRVAHFELILSR